MINQRIVILPAAIHNNAARVIRELFKNKEIIEIDTKAVDDLLNAVITTTPIFELCPCFRKCEFINNV